MATKMGFFISKCNTFFSRLKTFQNLRKREGKRRDIADIWCSNIVGEGLQVEGAIFRKMSSMRELMSIFRVKVLNFLRKVSFFYKIFTNFLSCNHRE